MSGTRTEHDLLGSMELPDDVLYGIQTERARRHFDASELLTRAELPRAYALVKKACARANRACGYLDEARADAIERACDEVADGRHDAHFVLDALQGGAGTSTNMNVNEVVARLATDAAGIPVHPLEHVNLHQSTNDTYATAVKVAAIFALQRLERAIIILQEACQSKEREFADVVKLGRTQLRDAVPTTLGRECGAWANALARDRWRVFKCIERLRVVNLGGTAIGTGIAAPRRYIFLAADMLREVTGLGLARAENLVEATQNQDAFVEVSGILRAHATTLVKMARDLRLMSSGPLGGLGEIELPALQPGSSIMPGKVNPVIPEMVTQAGYRVMAHDYEINLVVMSGELELNAFLPLLADALLRSLALLERTDRAFAALCIDGITANAGHCRALMERSQETVTALIPAIGHEAAVELARDMREHGCGIREAVHHRGLLDDAQLDHLLSAEHLCALGWREDEQGA
jgi:aspartate ammonia-lyase